MSLRICFFNPQEAKMKYSAIDLHPNNSVVTVTDEEDQMKERKPFDGKHGFP